MKSPLPLRWLSLACLSLGSTAQVPDGYFVWGSFQGTAGLNGIYFSHPRNPLEPVVEVTNLPPALAYDVAGRRGVACLLRRPSDGALIAGERAPAGTSVDLHVLKLRGADVMFAQLFSVGTSVAAGEIPQAALLPDGRIVVAASDLAAGGPLAQFQTTQYNWQGVGIIDTVSGSVMPIPIANLDQFPGVLNGLTVSVDGTMVYLGNYISPTSGDLWCVPVTGGQASQVATLPCGASNLALDNDGTILISALNGPPNLFRYDPVGLTIAPITTGSGPLNAVAIERVSGNYVLVTANAGSPARSILWMTPAGQETTLVSPNRATISTIDVNPNPEAFGDASTAQATYEWELAPSPGGLPLVGSLAFSLTVRASNATSSLAVVLLGPAKLTTPLVILGATIYVDPSRALALQLPFQNSVTLPVPIPNINSVVGLRLFAQSIHFEGGNALAATSGLEFTIL